MKKKTNLAQERQLSLCAEQVLKRAEKWGSDPFVIFEPTPDLSEVTNCQLARLLMTKLYRIYDAGGISVGRSYQSAILEAVMSLVPEQSLGRTPLYGEIHFGWWRVEATLDELFYEAAKRSPSLGCKQMLLFPLKEGVYHSSTLAVALLYHLEKYCSEHPEQGTWTMLDQDIIRAIRKLVSSSEVNRLFRFSLKSLLQSFQDRRFLAQSQSRALTALDL